MNLNKMKMLLQMALDKKVIKGLFNTYKLLKDDKNFTFRKYIKLLLSIIKGEKIVKYEGKYILSTFLPPFPSKAFYTNIKAVPSRENIFTQQIYAKRSAPISMYLCVTTKCPNNCLYCSSKNRSVGSELTTDEWINVIKDLQNMKTPIIGITGGEPLVRKDIFDIIKSIDKRSSSILFTSGINLTYEKAKLLKESGLFGIGISLDSYDKEIHNKNRNSDKAFDFAIKAIRTARKAGLYTMVQTVIIKDEVDEEKLFKLFKLAKDNGAHEVKILEPILSGMLLTTNDLSSILYNKKTREKLIKIQHKANKRGDMPKITSFPYTESKEKFGCGAGTQHSYISSNGDLYPCDFVPMNFGNVRDTSIKTLWKDMNRIIGDPKIGCFAQRVNRQVYNKSEGKLPLDFKQSVHICSSNRSKDFPDYYKNVW
jgi:MoaA/NifB/PqqE/SkfB family radical SAM enzyme